MSAATGAAGGFGEVGVFNGKPFGIRGLDVIDFRSAKIEIEFFGRNEFHIAEIILHIKFRIKLRIKAERILHSAASAAENSNAKHRRRLQILRRHYIVDFSYCRWCDNNGLFHVQTFIVLGVIQLFHLPQFLF